MGNEKDIREERDNAIQTHSPHSIPNAEWLANLSHELRSPLAAIQGYVTLLLRHETRITPEELHEFLEAISEGSTRMATVLDSLLDVASLEMGATSFRPFSFDLLQLVYDIIAEERHKYPDSTISLLVKNECAMLINERLHHYMILGDRLLIQKLLLQLLDNARKYTSTLPSITVTLASQALDQPIKTVPARIYAYIQEHKQPLVQLSIRDEGIGIPSEDYERIFERFERVDMQLTSPVSGLGLGLTMCKHIVKLHNGVIWAESLPDQGSVFQIILPAEEITKR